METILIGMDQKIDTLTTSMATFQTNCGGNRQKYNVRLKVVEDYVKDIGVIQTWKSVIFSKTTAVVLFLIALVDFVARFLPWGK
jgi:hypothetical protein